MIQVAEFFVLDASSGHNFLYGATTTAGTPNTPAPGCAFAVFTGQFPFLVLRKGASDQTGAWRVENLARSSRGARGYMEIAFDPAGQYDPACKANLIPSPMPPDPSEHV